MNRPSSRVLSIVACLLLWQVEVLGMPHLAYCPKGPCDCPKPPQNKKLSCVSGDYCYSEDDNNYSCLSSAEDRSWCTSESGCLCYNKAKPTIAKKMCPRGTRCIITSDQFGCVDDILENGSKCNLETCRCGFKSHYFPFNKPMVIEGPSCAKDEYCLFEDPKTGDSSNSAPKQNGWFCSKDVIGNKQISPSDSTLCVPTNYLAANQHVKCTKGSVCFSKAPDKSEPVCSSPPLTPGDKCSPKSDSYCVCLSSGPDAQGAHIKKGQTCFVDPVTKKVRSVEKIGPKETCSNLQGCLCSDPQQPTNPEIFIEKNNICVVVQSEIKPAFAMNQEVKICIEQPSCELRLRDNSKVKCAYLEWGVLQDKKPACLKTNFIFQRVCEDEECLCMSQTVLRHSSLDATKSYVFCTHGQFCGSKKIGNFDEPKCFSQILGPDKKCTEDEGCVCSSSTSEKSTEQATICEDQEICVFDTSSKKMACVTQKIEANSLGPHKKVYRGQYLCVAQDHPKPEQTSTRLCSNPKTDPIICGRKANDLACGENMILLTEPSLTKICSHYFCTCAVKENDAITSFEFCPQNSMCYTGPGGKATCTKPAIDLGKTCQDPNGCVYMKKESGSQNAGSKNVKKQGSGKESTWTVDHQFKFCAEGTIGIQLDDLLMCKDQVKLNVISDGSFCTNRAVGCLCKKDWNGAEKGVKCPPMADCKVIGKDITCSNKPKKIYFCPKYITCPCGSGLTPSDERPYCKIGSKNYFTDEFEDGDIVINEDILEEETIKQIQKGNWGFENTDGVGKSLRKLIYSQNVFV